MKLTCPKCGSSMSIMAQVTVSAPGEMYHNLSKTKLRDKDVSIVGVNWATCDKICTNVKCLHTIDGIMDYVSTLERKVVELEAKLAARG